MYYKKIMNTNKINSMSRGFYSTRKVKTCPNDVDLTQRTYRLSPLKSIETPQSPQSLSTMYPPFTPYRSRTQTKSKLKTLQNEFLMKTTLSKPNTFKFCYPKYVPIRNKKHSKEVTDEAINKLKELIQPENRNKRIKQEFHTLMFVPNAHVLPDLNAFKERWEKLSHEKIMTMRKLKKLRE